MAATDSIVSKMRQRKKETGLSLQDIADRTEQNGTPVSLATVKRVLSESATDYDFRYDTTLRPIAHALGLNLDPIPEEDEEMQAVLNALRDTYEARVADLWSAIKMLRRDKVVLIIIALPCCSLCSIFLRTASTAIGDFSATRNKKQLPRLVRPGEFCQEE